MSSPADIYMVIGGGLISCGADQGDQMRRAAGYVDRILSRARSLPMCPSLSSTSRPPRRSASLSRFRCRVAPTS